MSLLTTVRAACDRLGIVRPTTVVGSSDQQARQLLGLAQQEVSELGRRHPWQVLIKEKTFTATATETQSGALATDLDRFINGTFFNRDNHRFVQGPLEAHEWQSYKASTSTVIFDAFRVRGASLLMAPTPSAGVTYAYEYVSKYWIATSDNPTTGAQEDWQVDSDIALISEELVTLGVVWRFLKAKGLDYGEAFRTYEAQVMLAMTRDTPRRTVSLAKASDYRRARRPTWPDGSWNIS